jgi:G:T-mismatch repair DNA endonuclease (very short patch repair protein)
MRIVIAFAVLAVTVFIAGCFHHRQQVYEAEIPPPISTPPYK